MRVSMAAIIHRARWNFNVDEADGVSRRDSRLDLTRLPTTFLTGTGRDHAHAPSIR